MPRFQYSSPSQYPISALWRCTSSPGRTPMAPTANWSTSIANTRFNPLVLARRIQLRASACVYGYGKTSRRLIHTLRLLAWRTSEGSSPRRHSRSRQRVSWRRTGSGFIQRHSTKFRDGTIDRIGAYQDENLPVPGGPRMKRTLLLYVVIAFAVSFATAVPPAVAGAVSYTH